MKRIVPPRIAKSAGPDRSALVLTHEAAQLLDKVVTAFAVRRRSLSGLRTLAIRSYKMNEKSCSMSRDAFFPRNALAWELPTFELMPVSMSRRLRPRPTESDSRSPSRSSDLLKRRPPMRMTNRTPVPPATARRPSRIPARTPNTFPCCSADHRCAHMWLVACCPKTTNAATDPRGSSSCRGRAAK